MFPAYFLQEFGSQLQDRRAQAREADEKAADREYQILSILAQHGSEEIKGMAGASLLDLAQNTVSGRKGAKGIRGFLGESEKSPYMDQVRSAMTSARVAPPQPQSAAMSTNAPVSPGSQPIAAAPAAPPLSGAPPTQAGQLDRSGQMAMAGPEGPEMQQGPAPLASSANTVGAMLPQAPPEPKIRSLFPTAEEIARDKVTENSALLKGRLDTTATTLQQYGATPREVQDAMLGISGAPRSRRPLAVPMILTVNGQEVLGVFDPDTQTYEVDGVAVQPSNARRPSTSAPQGQKPVLRPGANGEYQWIYPPEASAPAAPGAPGAPAAAPTGPDMSVTSVPTGVKRPPPQPSPTAPMSTFTGDPDGPGPAPSGVYARNRDGSVGEKLGDPPPRAGGQVTDQQRQYKVWKDVVDKNLAALGKNKFTGRATVLTDTQRDQEAAKISKNPQMTYNELAMGAQGGTVPERGKSGVSRDEFKELLNDMAKQFSGAGAGGTVQGSGAPMTPAPPAPPAPPKR